jgi:hypothetical protein
LRRFDRAQAARIACETKKIVSPIALEASARRRTIRALDRGRSDARFALRAALESRHAALDRAST